MMRWVQSRSPKELGAAGSVRLRVRSGVVGLSLLVCACGGAETPPDSADAPHSAAPPSVVVDTPTTSTSLDATIPVTVSKRRPWPPTVLPLGLLATLNAADESQSRATIRDDENGVIASYRPGDMIRAQVKVLAVEDGLVELLNDGEVEYLSVSEIPVELSADDAFYPDLIEDLHRSGSMDDAIELPPSPQYTIKSGQYAWGTPRTIARLRDAIANYAGTGEVPAVHIGDLSRRAGGPFPPHISHQQGRDVDIAYVLQGTDARFANANESNLERGLTWSLLRAMIDTGAVRYIFIDYEVQRLLYGQALAEGATADTLDALFQFPYGRRAARGVIRHWKGHRNHFHVRFDP